MRYHGCREAKEFPGKEGQGRGGSLIWWLGSVMQPYRVVLSTLSDKRHIG